MTQRNRVIWQYQDLSSDPSSSSRIIFAVFRNLYLILNWWTTQREAHAISMNPNGRIWKMVLCLPGDHIKNHTMQVHGKSTVMPLLRVINKNWTICTSVFCNNNDCFIFQEQIQFIRILFFVLLATEKPIKREWSFYIKELICNVILTLEGWRSGLHLHLHNQEPDTTTPLHCPWPRMSVM